MSIPPVNNFLVPFLQILSSGQRLTRQQILTALRQRLQISDADAQTMSGKQNALANRIAWCDVYLVKAGFINKWQHPLTSAQDHFEITPLGARQCQYHADEINVAYVRQFYQTAIYRGSGSDQSTSEAEYSLFERFDDLTDEFTIFHSIPWFGKRAETVGEIDFLIAHPQLGLLIIEVKGGQVSLNEGAWYSTNRYGQTHTIHDPCKQGERNRRVFQDWLREHPTTARYPYAVFHAVALPDSQVSQDVRPDCPQAIFIDQTHLDDLRGRLHQIYTYWQARADRKHQKMGGKEAIEALIQLLIPTRQLSPKTALIFERERRKIEELTQQQLKLLQFLSAHKRATIIGGAGTGKTMMAMEKTQILLEAGFRVLFLCFNKNLKQWLDTQMQHNKLMVATFHGLVGSAINWAGVNTVTRDQSFYEQAGELLVDAAAALQQKRSPYLFDAIIVDEGQDFEETWWIGLPDLLHDPKNGVFYVFFDDNQRIYRQITHVPMDKEPFRLTENCRNTQHIHTQMTFYAQAGGDQARCFGPEGRPVEQLTIDSPQAARRELQRLLHRLCHEEQLPNQEIIVLTARSQKNSQWSEGEALGNFRLTWNLTTTAPYAIRICSIATYKGLENAVVILTELDQAREEIQDPLIYVGLSRARNQVYVLGQLPKPLGKLKPSSINA